MENGETGAGEAHSEDPAGQNLLYNAPVGPPPVRHGAGESGEWKQIPEEPDREESDAATQAAPAAERARTWKSLDTLAEAPPSEMNSGAPRNEVLAAGFALSAKRAGIGRVTKVPPA